MKTIKKFSAYFFFLLLGIAISTGVQVVYAHGGNTNFIHSCVKSNGAISIVSAGTNCASNETATDWTKVPWNSDFPLMCQNCDLTATTVGSLFAGKDLSNALLQHSQFDSVDFQTATLVHTNFKFSSFDGANFTSVNASGAKFSGGGSMNNTIFVGTNLTNTVFDGNSVTGADFTGANASNAAMTGTSFGNSNFTNANLSSVNFTDSNLTGANFTGTTRSGIIWSNTTCPDGSNSDSNGNTCEGHL